MLLARQTLIQRVKDMERDNLYQKYKDLVGEIITGEVYQVWSREALIMDKDDNELVMQFNKTFAPGNHLFYISHKTGLAVSLNRFEAKGGVCDVEGFR